MRGVSWPIAPLLEADWRELEPALTAELRQRLLDTRDRWSRAPFFGTLEHFRLLPLACYPRLLSIEALVRIEGKPDSVLWFLYGPPGVLPLEGTSTVFHDLNGQSELDISTPVLAAEYLRLFCYAVHGDMGPFAVLDSRDQLERIAGPGVPADDRFGISPIEIVRQPAGGYSAGTRVLYGNMVFAARFDTMLATREMAELVGYGDGPAVLDLAPDEMLLQIAGDDAVVAKLPSYRDYPAFAGMFDENRFYDKARDPLGPPRTPLNRYVRPPRDPQPIRPPLSETVLAHDPADAALAEKLAEWWRKGDA